MEQGKLFGEHPRVSCKLTGAKILILNNNGGDWVKVGKQYTIKKAREGKILIDRRWWHCSSNECRRYFELVEPPPKVMYLAGPVERVANNLLGIKVQRGPDWEWEDQDEGADYGEITLIVSETYVYVTWRKGSVPLRGNYYRVNRAGKFDLAYHEKFKQTLRDDRIEHEPEEPARAAWTIPAFPTPEGKPAPKKRITDRVVQIPVPPQGAVDRIINERQDGLGDGVFFYPFTEDRPLEDAHAPAPAPEQAPVRDRITINDLINDWDRLQRIRPGIVERGGVREGEVGGQLGEADPIL